MKAPFYDPAKPKKHEPKARPVDGKNTPWDYTCPEYDQRSSCFVKCGTNYGSGINQPVGHFGDAKGTVPVMPKGARSINIDIETY